MKLDLDELERLANAATDGPWAAPSPRISHWRRDVCSITTNDGMGIANNLVDTDAAFIARARTAVPELIAEVRRLREALGERNNMTAKEWNEKYPVGTKVIYRPIRDSDDRMRETRTRSEAWELGHGQAVVCIEGTAGGVALWALEALGEGRK